MKPNSVGESFKMWREIENACEKEHQSVNCDNENCAGAIQEIHFHSPLLYVLLFKHTHTHTHVPHQEDEN